MLLDMDKLPFSVQNPYLVFKEFFKYCRFRFRQIGGSENDFKSLIGFYEENKLFVPVSRMKNCNIYATYQVYNLYFLENARLSTLSPLANFVHKGKDITPKILAWVDAFKGDNSHFYKLGDNFNALLLFLLCVQDYYLPEVRSDERFGEIRHYYGQHVLGGINIKNCSNISLGEFRIIRQKRLINGEYNPQNLLQKSELSVEDLEKWLTKLSVIVNDLDPCCNWYELYKYFGYEKKQKLKYEALLSQDFYEMYKIVELFLEDIGSSIKKKGISDIFDWIDLSARDLDAGMPYWKKKFYGENGYSNQFLMLGYLCNSYNISPLPRAIIFTEGDEFEAIGKLFEYYGYPAGLLGIEFRSIKGIGEFTLSNWQPFIEYMHERQVIIYFLLDNEGESAKQARRLLSANRKYKNAFLSKVFPQNKKEAKNRIVIWGKGKNFSSFEEANFSDAQIAEAFRTFGHNIKPINIFNIRNDPNRKKGLINAIAEYLNVSINKREFPIVLIENLIKLRISKPNVKSVRPIELFMHKSVEEIIKNRLANSEYDKSMILKSGKFG